MKLGACLVEQLLGTDSVKMGACLIEQLLGTASVKH